MKKVKIKIKEKKKIVNQLIRSHWIGYKSVLEELNTTPYIDNISITKSKLLFDIFLLENVVQFRDNKFTRCLDYEIGYGDYMFNSFDYLKDQVQLYDDVLEVENYPKNMGSNDYIFDFSFLDSLIVSEFDDDFLI